MFEYSRKLLTKTSVKKFLSEIFKDHLDDHGEGPTEDGNIPKEATRTVTETQFFALLEKNPKFAQHIENYLAEIPDPDSTDPIIVEKRKAWQDKFRTWINESDVLTEFKKYNDPLEPFVLRDVERGFGYSNPKVFVNHKRKLHGKNIKAVDLKQVAIDFIKSAKKSLILNIYDFDLLDIADELVLAHKRGVKVSVGMDKRQLEGDLARQAVIDVFNRLKDGGVNVVSVDSVGLNHQKLMAIDWEDKKLAKVYYSSGNMTQSGIGPEGDLVDLPDKLRPKISVPNANHTVTIDSYLLANLVHHQLTMTLDLKLRGAEFPLSGTYEVIGEKPQTHLLAAFTPRGVLKNVNKNLFSKIIKEASKSSIGKEGKPFDIAQFAFSTKTVQNALLEAAKWAKENGYKFNLRMIGDTPFTTTSWSAFLRMSGYEEYKKELSLEDGSTTKVKFYFKNPYDPWKHAFNTTAEYEEFTNNIFTAPRSFGHLKVDVDGEQRELTVKLHHKILIAGDAAVIGTSFNLSTGAESNSEQALIIFDKDMADEGRSIVDSLIVDSKGPVKNRIMSKNAWMVRQLGDQGLNPKEVFDSMQKEYIEFKDKEMADCDSSLVKVLGGNSIII